MESTEKRVSHIVSHECGYPVVIVEFCQSGKIEGFALFHLCEYSTYYVRTLLSPKEVFTSHMDKITPVKTIPPKFNIKIMELLFSSVNNENNNEDFSGQNTDMNLAYNMIKEYVDEI